MDCEEEFFPGGILGDSGGKGTLFLGISELGGFPGGSGQALFLLFVAVQERKVSACSSPSIVVNVAKSGPSPVPTLSCSLFVGLHAAASRPSFFSHCHPILQTNTLGKCDVCTGGA